MERQMIYEPISRFWSAFFSAGIFALFWTLKMGKTRKWLLACILPQIIYSTLYVVFFDFPEPSIHLSPLLEFFIELGFLLLWVNAIYFMYKWTSAYNLKACGYTSKREWIKSIINKANLNSTSNDSVSIDTSDDDSDKHSLKSNLPLPAQTPPIIPIPINWHDAPDGIHPDLPFSKQTPEVSHPADPVDDTNDVLPESIDETPETLEDGSDKKQTKEEKKQAKKQAKENKKQAKKDEKQAKKQAKKDDKEFKRQYKEDKKQAKKDEKRAKEQTKENKKRAEKQAKEDKKRAEKQAKENKKQSKKDEKQAKKQDKEDKKDKNQPDEILNYEQKKSEEKPLEAHKPELGPDDIPLPSNIPAYPHAEPFLDTVPETPQEPQPEYPSKTIPDAPTDLTPEEPTPKEQTPNTTLYDKSAKATLYDEPDDSTYEFSEPDERN